jgi:hypothetical protein
MTFPVAFLGVLKEMYLLSIAVYVANIVSDTRKLETISIV